MKLHLYSDLHLDCYKDWGAGLLLNVSQLKADVAVLAGDITTGKFQNSFRGLFEQLSKQYTYVIAVPGNHEYYGADEATVKRSYELAADGLFNIHVLDCQSVKLGGQIFHGGTMWYRYVPGLEAYEHWMPDIHHIIGFKPWVYEKQRQFEQHLEQHLSAGDVVISHHLPSQKSVARFYKNSQLNPFFVCDMEKLIVEREPALWLHGHTHTPADYHIVGINLKHTRVVCNPRGYPRESAFGPVGYMPKEIEL